MPTFGDVARLVRLHVPDAPATLAQEWVKTAYRRIADRRGWAWSVFQGEMVYTPARDVVVTATVGSRTVTSAGLFLPEDDGRQFRIGTFPVYTCTYVDANTLTLDMAWYPATGDSGVYTCQILTAYFNLPINFGRFVVIVDPVWQRFVPWWTTQEELDLLDPTRTSADSTPRLLVARLVNDAGFMQYEAWPYPTSATGALQYYAISRPECAMTDTLRGVLAHRADILQEGALSQAAKWPGLPNRKNPYFNLQLSTMHNKQFEDELLKLDLRDDDQSFQSIETVPWSRWSAWGWAYNTHLLQQTDATLGAYAGMGGWYGPGW